VPYNYYFVVKGQIFKCSRKFSESLWLQLPRRLLSVLSYHGDG
jgi:hypothetical protein